MECRLIRVVFPTPLLFWNSKCYGAGTERKKAQSRNGRNIARLPEWAFSVPFPFEHTRFTACYSDRFFGTENGTGTARNRNEIRLRKLACFQCSSLFHSVVPWRTTPAISSSHARLSLAVRASFRAYRNIIGLNGPEPRLPGSLVSQYSHDQLYFLSFANIWCDHETDDQIEDGIIYDVHSPGKYRILGTLQNYQVSGEYLVMVDCGHSDDGRSPNTKDRHFLCPIPVVDPPPPL